MRRRGFTLVEVMIAASITAVIGALVAGAFQRAAAARELAEAQDERFTGARLALTRMAREVEEAFLSEHYDRKRFTERPTLFRGLDRGQEDDLLFATFAHARLLRDAKEADQAVVEYSVGPDPDRPGARALFRREKPRIDEDPERGGARAVVLEHVVGFDVQYWDWKRQEWAREWDTSSADRKGFLPTRVRFRLVLRMPDGKDRPFETQARVAIVRPLDF
ncbi:MAG TPA: prepilin-type N-terminal cleavage/methylation domain-containing protein [Anaeromyxobacteraceae bacterium]|jgi:general secretion pathway protein J